MNINPNPFKSFWMAGYECSDQLNCFGNRVNLLQSSGHLQLIDDDYTNLTLFNIKTVREGICWSQVEKKPYEYDWTNVLMLFEKGVSHHVQQLWDICHFGYADDLTPLHPLFAKRFAALCSAFAAEHKKYLSGTPLIVTPINEVSFISWLGGDVKGTSPYCTGEGWQVKYNLMRAYIEGIEAMKKINPEVRILTTEPMINVVAPIGATQQMITDAASHTEAQYQATDILCGKLCPELGGKPEYLDLIGLNYYYNNQWTVDTHEFLNWKQQPFNSGWLTLTSLLKKYTQRYQRPLVITETSHFGEDRPEWIKFIGSECVAALKNNIPLLGVCIYPIVDRTDWDNTEVWHHSGIWDAGLQTNKSPARILYQRYADELVAVQNRVNVLL